ncbi:hypothetical protein [Streptomyces noursei]|uniref:hypothetical protein n=1 Tax=Streptomyces noursei TaxID=1971 RepID=UPI0019651A49|nr:hypothetical protein [Streptomyces noursei]QRX90498.1 hypothetical protein JNO44_06295 [Streptomyces noursei]
MADRPAAELPAPEELWAHAATLARWSAEHPLPVHNYRVEGAVLRSEDVGNGWWALTRVAGGRAVLYGIDNDYSDTVGCSPPMDLLAGGPAWLPWDHLTPVVHGEEAIGFVLWWADGVWRRAPYPAALGDDGASTMVPADDGEVREVLAALRADGTAAAEVQRKEAQAARAVREAAAPPVELPAGRGEPAGRRVPCWLPEHLAAALAVAMRASAESARALPAGDDVAAAEGVGAGRWLYVRVSVTDDGVGVERAYDQLPGWWRGTAGISDAWPETVRRERTQRAPRHRPSWVGLLEEDVFRTGLPAELCAVTEEERAGAARR